METQTTNHTALKVGLTIAVTLGGAGFLVYSSLDHAQHYEMVDELLASDLSQWQGTELKLHGFVGAGTIVEKVVDQEIHRTFILYVADKRIRVFADGPKPDVFKDDSEVIATGELMPTSSFAELARQMNVPLETDPSYVLAATDLSAKCPSRYGAAGINNDKNVDKPFEREARLAAP